MNRIAAGKHCKLRFNPIEETRRVKESEYILPYAELEDPPKQFLACILMFTSS